MQQVQCPRGLHVYTIEPGQSNHCKACASIDAELIKTRPVYEPDPTTPNYASPPSRSGHNPNATVGVYAHLDTEVDPVVGWLACIEGPDKGRDWRLVAGRNTLGRNEGMQVRLAGDASVSGERHAIVSFEPRRRSFTLLPGDSRGLVYLNGEEVVTPVPLKMHDRIELGKSSLLFVALAGPAFGWTDDKAA